ncbi:type II secretory pathway protein [Pseudoalteromonas sp. CnMc7-15]|uniref:secretin N-terminal domain-containing protein n=1 Tax=unclassified Pseudoalteromonas TaxID=194690 RepID=UPI001EF535E2|nr:secretin N-terminal domain-containing protein [Pseudoalteromonas sp. CnMc7-15]MCG7566513.1 type II secretory pathway protein [Pseudoalteromonas sp. CnMc7-15]
MRHRIKPCALLITSALFINGCASLVNPNAGNQPDTVSVERSYLEREKRETSSDTVAAVEQDESSSELVRLKNLKDTEQALKLEIDLSKRFGEKKQYQLSVNALPLNEFIHYTLGDLLGISYLVEPSIKAKNNPVTLELKEAISAQRVFQLTQEVLAQNGASLSLSDDIFYIYPQSKKNKSEYAFGFGRSVESVPQVSSEIIQLVPLEYGVSSGLNVTLRSLLDAKLHVDSTQNMVIVEGKRTEVQRAINIIQMVDSKALYDKAMAMMSFKYIATETFVEKAQQLLEQEGYSAKSGGTNAPVVNFIPIEHLGKLVVFSNSDKLIDRLEYWQKQLDKPATGSEQSFYIYHPRYARASDLGQSLAPLLSGQSFFGDSQSTREQSEQPSAVASDNQNRGQQKATQTIQGDGIRLVVDERANALIFYSTGQYYQELQPIIKQLDIMPKQVMMEVVIAEVKLTGSYAKGVEYAIKSGASTSDRQETFSFDNEGGFSYSIVGLPGNININLNQTDGLVNVLSRPTLLVRDGVAANISVGDDIPTIGSTTTDPISGDRQTTEIQYRKTGVDLTVTPTINAQGTVIMTIAQNISSVNDGQGAGGNPAIFERTLSTEVVAGDGQTVMLGGLISETSTNGSNSVPGLGDIPVLGHLFRSDSGSSDKTELVVLVTPKIVKDLQDWQRVKQSFIQGLENLKF